MEANSKADPLHILVDIDKPLICETQWIHDNGNIVQCTNDATWQANVHDEVYHHVEELTLLCGECVIVLGYKNSCEKCGSGMLNNLRHL